MHVPTALISLAHAATASQLSAYILRPSTSSSSSTPPSLPPQLASAILQQRIAWPHSDVASLPDDTDDDAFVQVAAFGRSSSVFDNSQAASPRQFVLLYQASEDGDAHDSLSHIRQVLGKPTFTSPELSRELRGEEAPKSACGDLAAGQHIDTTAAACWTRLGAASRFLQTTVTPRNGAKLATALKESLKAIQQEANAGTIETTIILAPPASVPAADVATAAAITETKDTKGGFTTTTTTLQNQELRRRSLDSSPGEPHIWARSTASPIPACFTSFNACATATSNCSGHGECVGRHGSSSCFACRCMATQEKPNAKAGRKGGLYHWGGNMCQKQDVSTPFWLFVGFSIAMTLLVAGCLGLLFGVGEEKLPGVIGAGVSRSK